MKHSGYIKGGTGGYMVGGYVALPLSPGEYVLDSFKRTLSGGTSSFGGASVTQSTQQRLPLSRSFTVKSGQVTNLGQIILVPDEKDPESKRYRIFTVDNTNDMRHFLEVFYPQLYASIGPAAVTLAPGKYEQGEDLQRLRRYMALLALSMTNGSAADGSFVAGPAGTFAKVERAGNGNLKQVHLIEMPFMAGVAKSASHLVRKRAAVVTTDQRFYSVRSGKVEQRVLPANEIPHRLFLFSESGVVVLDDKFNVYTSQDDGRNWQRYSAAATATRQYSVNDELIEDTEGYYLVGEFPPRLLYTKYGLSDYQQIRLPDEATNIHAVTPRLSHLFLEKEITAWTEKTPSPFFVRQRAGGEWETRYKPKATCGGPVNRMPLLPQAWRDGFLCVRANHPYLK